MYNKLAVLKFLLYLIFYFKSIFYLSHLNATNQLLQNPKIILQHAENALMSLKSFVRKKS